MNYKESIEFLTNKSNFYIDLGLNRISDVLSALQNPQDSLKFIHVAGTNGKGSVSAMLDSILREAGYKTGLYTSPHIFEYTERIKFCGKDISREEFSGYIKKISEQNIHLTEFEILTVLSFLYFKDKKADIVILETGLGGRLDATNVITKNLCSVITHIDLDHTERLGEIKEKIAYEKAGIVKKNCPLITAENYNSIREKAEKENSPIIVPNKNIPEKYIQALSLKGEHQKENLSLVICLINYLFKDINEETVIKGLKNVKHPFRYEYFKDKNLIIDASHNPNGIQALRNNLDKDFAGQKRRYIFGCLKNKDYKQMMEILFREDDEIYLNEFDYPNACSYTELEKCCPYTAQKYTSLNVLKNDRLNIVCGSFYMIGKLFG